MILRKQFKFYIFILFMSFFFLITVTSPLYSDSLNKKGLRIEVKGAIGPASQGYIEQAIEKASNENFAFLIIQLDTPGGLDSSMRGIIQAILSSNVPIITYVAPSGARAASAGTYILYASQIAAMAPGTNMGAASPVNMGHNPIQSDPENKDKNKNLDNDSVMDKKMKQDAAAFIRSLASLRGRNSQFAEDSVLQAKSISAEEAYKLHVIDVIANNTEDLLKKINGLTIQLQDKKVTLDTNNVSLDNFEAGWRYHILSILTDPNIAYILMLIGIYGIFFEFSAPGFILPGVIGGICLILALYAFQLLPINYAGFGLLILGIVFMILEIYSPTFGALGIGGVIAFIIGSIFLLEPNVPGYNIAWSVILMMTLVTSAFFVTLFTLAFRSQKKQVVIGSSTLIGAEGIVIENKEQLLVRIKGEIWKAYSDTPLEIGQRVIVTELTGLNLKVEPKMDEKKLSK